MASWTSHLDLLRELHDAEMQGASRRMACAARLRMPAPVNRRCEVVIGRASRIAVVAS